MTLFRQCFPADPKVRELGPEEIRARGLPFTYWCEFLEDWRVWSPLTGWFTIPKGFLSDGASIPFFLWGLISDTAPYILFAAYGHDFLFSVRGILPNGKKLGLRQANRCIVFWMKACSSALWRAAGVAFGLALGSWVYWNKDKPAAKVASAQ